MEISESLQNLSELPPPFEEAAQAPIEYINGSSEDGSAAGGDDNGDDCGAGSDQRSSAAGPSTDVSPTTSAAVGASEPQASSARLPARHYAVQQPVPVGKGSALPPATAAKPAHKPASRPGPEASSAKPPVKRTKRSQRCGKCETCLNPHWKKACLEIRRQQEEGAEAQAAQQQQQQLRAAAVANDPFVRTLSAILSPGGGVMHAKHVRLLLDLLGRAATPPHRAALLSVLQKSAPEVQLLAVQQKALLRLQDWLATAIESKKPKTVARIIGCLTALPVTIGALQSPCKLGLLVGKLRKAEGFEDLHMPAKQLVAQWKAVARNSDTTSVPTVKQKPAAPSRPKPTGSAAAAAPPSAAPAALSPPSAGAAPPSTKAAATPEPSALLDEGDIFGAADRLRAKEAAGTKPAPKLLPDSKGAGATTSLAPATTLLLSSASLPSAAAQPLLTATEPPQGTALAGDGVKHVRAPNAARVSASPLDSLGSSAAPPSSLGGGVTVLGAGGALQGSILPRVFRTAAERAREAAARVPSPEPPAERPAKPKKVGWVDDSGLLSVRWFRKTDAPVAVKEDAADDAPVAGQLEASPPRFASAAKEEHLLEADALRKHRIQEDKEKSEVVARLAALHAEVAWYDPPLVTTAASAELGVACGEESEEARIAAARRARQPPAVYATPVDIPWSPDEPVGMEAHGIAQNPSHIPRIPLSVQEAREMLERKAHTQYQQQRQMQMQVPQPPQPQLQQQGTYMRPGQAGYGVPSAAQPVPSAAYAQVQHPPAAAAVSLPGGIGDTLAQLAASGLLGSMALQAPAAPQPQQLMQQQQYQQLPAQYQQQQQRPPMPQPHQQQRPQLPAQYQQRPQRPLLPPGMKPMLGLHRRPAPGEQGQQAPVVHPGTGRVLEHRPRSKTPCRFFHTAEGCRMGDTCRFAHIPAHVGAKRPMVDEEQPQERCKQRRTFTD